MSAKKDTGYAWIIAINSLLIYSLFVISFTSFGVLIVYITEATEHSYTIVSWIGGISKAVTGFSGIFYGSIAKKFSCRTILFSSSVLLASCYFASVFVHSVTGLFISLGLAAGFSYGALSFCAEVSVAGWFMKSKSLAIAMCSLGTSIGVFIWTPLTNMMVHAYGWRSTLLLLAGVHLNGCVLAMIIRKPPVDDNKDENDISERFCVLFDKNLWTNVPFCLLCFALLGLYAGHMQVFFMLPTRADVTGLGTQSGTYVVSSIALSSGLCRLLVGYLGDRVWFNRFLAFSLSIAVGGLLTILSVLFQSFPMLITYGVLFGIVSSFYVAYTFTMITDVVKPKEIPGAAGLAMIFIGLSQLISNSLGGFLYDQTKSPLIPFIKKNMSDKKDTGYAWVIMINAMICNALSVLAVSSQSILIIYITESLEESYGKVSIMTSLLNLFYGGSSLFSGILDRIFTRTQLLFVGSFMVVLCHILSVYIKSVYLFYITLGIVSGIGLNTFTFCSGISVAGWFERKKSLALACISVGTSIGFLIWSPLTNLIITNYGWRSALLLIGAIYAHGLASALLIRPPPQENNKSSIEKSKESPKRNIFDKRIFKNYSLLFLYLSVISTYTGHMVPYFWIPTRTKGTDVGLEKGTLIVSALAGSSLVVRIFIGILGDKPWFNRMIAFGKRFFDGSGSGLPSGGGSGFPSGGGSGGWGHHFAKRHFSGDSGTKGESGSGTDFESGSGKDFESGSGKDFESGSGKDFESGSGKEYEEKHCPIVCRALIASDAYKHIDMCGDCELLKTGFPGCEHWCFPIPWIGRIFIRDCQKCDAITLGHVISFIEHHFDDLK
ncbi:DgyrCDS1718 [Dimorphilus gyrociliatus]|uniref:DgyrCDS1718 n=1 Tax=Dimorphilus gyrociliatus TaxID=2664684 RepID=A0A7I8VDB2_9ANNE|nr:DgyrCDS1718 [Dimorphilus gyrociliatus]